MLDIRIIKIFTNRSDSKCKSNTLILIMIIQALKKYSHQMKHQICHNNCSSKYIKRDNSSNKIHSKCNLDNKYIRIKLLKRIML